MSCPNGCDSTPKSCPVRANKNTFAKSKATEFENFKGISSATGRVDSNPVIVLNIDQDEYATENHFKNRDTFENRDNTVVEDVGPNKVRLEFLRVKMIVTAMECPECGLIYDPDINKVFDNPNKLY